MEAERLSILEARCSFFYEIVIQHFDHRRSRF